MSANQSYSYDQQQQGQGGDASQSGGQQSASSQPTAQGQASSGQAQAQQPYYNYQRYGNYYDSNAYYNQSQQQFYQLSQQQQAAAAAAAAAGQPYSSYPGQTGASSKSGDDKKSSGAPPLPYQTGAGAPQSYPASFNAQLMSAAGPAAAAAGAWPFPNRPVMSQTPTKPRITTTFWEDENTVCYQVEARGISVSRREDSNFINGTKLLNVTGMTRGRRDGILKTEKTRYVVKIGAMNLKGVWIPFERAFELARNEGIADLLFPLFVRDIKSFFLSGGGNAYAPPAGAGAGSASGAGAGAGTGSAAAAAALTQGAAGHPGSGQNFSYTGYPSGPVATSTPQAGSENGGATNAAGGASGSSGASGATTGAGATGAADSSAGTADAAAQQNAIYPNYPAYSYGYNQYGYPVNSSNQQYLYYGNYQGQVPQLQQATNGQQHGAASGNASGQQSSGSELKKEKVDH